MQQTQKSKSWSVLASLVGLWFSSGFQVMADDPKPSNIQFNRDIRPILSDNCFACHGPDPNHREAKLRLDDRDAALSAGVIQPGKPEESEILARILSQDPAEHMPPEKSNKKLTDAQKELLKQWIAQGATYQKHWAYEKPVKPAVPKGVNGIDFLVRKRLAAIGLKPSPQADRRTLTRRLYFDLIGLPPTPQRMEQFLADADPKAYETLVEALLSNAHHGERMAIGWLDMVRFADTIGYHSDNPRNVWPYRDWVIKSFNDNKRFDRFTTEQLAGDLMPDADQETRVGSAFNRLLLTTEEGGAQPKDYESRSLADRVRAVGAVWLGQTTGCAQCHDHKFDPISTIKEPSIGNQGSGMPVPTLEQAEKLASLDQQMDSAQKAFDDIAPKLDEEQKSWELEILKDQSALAKLQPAEKATPAGKKAALAFLENLKKPADKRTPAEKKILSDYFRGSVTKQFPKERSLVGELQKQKAALLAQTPKCLVSVKAETLRTVRIQPRGNWLDESGEVVKAAFPEYLPKPDLKGRTPDRLDLAKWLVSKENPLTARVFVNRLMAQYFGKGLSKMLDDLGTQGEPPVNPELLDWLACEFMESGWDVRHMVRTIVTSETYKQVSTASKDLRERDPDNRELARQTPMRIDAELVRDNALFISGLLDMHIGGPSVKPYQPENYWENLNFPIRSYDADTGPAQYRRGMYTWWQRSFLHPSMLSFDAPSREECTAERNRSNLPQQALILLNDPTYVEAARNFATRILRDLPKADMSERIIWAWGQTVQRKPTVEELSTTTKLLEKQLLTYQNDLKSADELLRTGLSPVPTELNKSELAAWTHLARVLLNLHETITRE